LASPKLLVTFLDPLRTEHHNSDRKIKMILTEPFRFLVQMPDGGAMLFTVPAGFVTDLASIPRAVWWIPGFSPFGRIEKSSVAHDWLYSVLSQLPSGFGLDPTDDYGQRLFADDVMYYGMETDGECLAVRGIVNGFVRAFGASHWKTP
jgi:hypothetical protein